MARAHERREASIGFALMVVTARMAALAALAYVMQANAASDFIEGREVVSGAATPEAGVWVIAETAALPTPYRKIVVTDDEGRFVSRTCPPADYQVWVRGYGLVDSAKTAATRGAIADVARDARSRSATGRGDLSSELLVVVARATRSQRRLGQSVQARVPAVSSGRLADHALEESRLVRPRVQEGDVDERDREPTEPSATARCARRLGETDRGRRDAGVATATRRVSSATS